jgi:curli production assembly/transport component CsgF
MHVGYSMAKFSGRIMADFLCNTKLMVLTAAIVAAVALVTVGPASASSLVYQPTNPSFGGSPNNGGFLLSLANAQNIPLANQTAAQAAAAAAARGGAGGTGSSALTPGQIFAQQLQSQLLSSFANQITQAIFGANAQQSGNFSFGSTSINFVKVGGQINIAINDGTSITNIVVPASP